MANEVYANGLEIACKAADGKSVSCFPDPCWSPPSPSAGWILIPYANTAYAKDTSNASKTVYISGKPIMKKDCSYFKTSTGNEPAAGPKGLITGVKKGKAYFTSWSMNVFIEGENVDRHTDLMTHNHGSKPGNTSVWVYSDTRTKPPKACMEDCIKIEQKCGKGISRNEAKKMCGSGKSPEKEKEKTKRSRKKGNAIRMFKEKFGDKIKDFRTWKQEHCAGPLMINTCSTPEQIQEQIENLTDIGSQVKKMQDKIPKMFGEFVDGLGWDSLKQTMERRNDERYSRQGRRKICL